MAGSELDFNRLVGLLTGAQPDLPALEDRIFLHQAFASVLAVFQQLDDTTQVSVKDVLETGSRNASPFIAAFAQSVMHTLDGAAHKLHTLVEPTDFEADPAGAVSDFLSLYLLRADVLSKGSDTQPQEISAKAIQNAYEHLSSQARAVYNLLSPPDPNFVRNNDRVAIVINQFLAPGHAPSDFARNYAHSLVKDFGKEVVIFCAGEFTPYKCGRLFSLTSFAMAKEQDYTPFTYKDAPLSLYQPTNRHDVFTAVAQTAVEIQNFAPSFILGVGQFSLMGEMLSDRIPTLLSPMGFSSLPHVDRVTYHLHRPPSEAMKAGMKALSLEDRFLFSHKGGVYDPPERKAALTRTELGLPDDKVVFIIVGNRLPTECDTDFMTMLDTLCAAPSVHLLILGQFPDLKETYGHLGALMAHHTHIDYHTDLMSVYDCCDVFIAPKRAGGGSSAAYALSAALPVLAEYYGDTEHSLKPFPRLDTPEQLELCALDLATAPATLVHYRALASEGAKTITPTSRLVAKFVEIGETLMPS